MLRTINLLTPDPVEAYLAQVRAYVIDQGLPIISGALGTTPVIPQIDTGSPELNAAAQSVVRITGNALACGVSQAGTGFVIADDRVVTKPTPREERACDRSARWRDASGSVVYFDAQTTRGDLRPGSRRAHTAGDLGAGSDSAIAGYPYGSVASGAASVIWWALRQLTTSTAARSSRGLHPCR